MLLPTGLYAGPPFCRAWLYTATVSSFIGAVRFCTATVTSFINTVSHYTATVRLYIGAVANYTATARLYTGAVSKSTSTVRHCTATVRQCTNRVSHCTATLSIYKCMLTCFALRAGPTQKRVARLISCATLYRDPVHPNWFSVLF
jgi:hypothetical protein